VEVHGIDERHLVREHEGADFVLFVYQGDPAPDTSWSVDSEMITDATLPEVLAWLPSRLPEDCCWSLGVITEPSPARPEEDFALVWVVGADLLNADSRGLGERERRLVDEMLARRHRVDL
jgi:hypothetical protein